MPRKSIPFSNWNTMIQGLDYSPQEFFGLVEEAIQHKNIDDLKITRIKMGEGGVLSAKREYLRVSRKRLVFDICGAPFGNGFFVSWWLGETPSGLAALLLSIPYVGGVVHFFANMFKPETYFSYDTRAMYRSLIHDAVTNVVDHITEDKGLRSLTQDEKKPYMKSFFDKA